MNFIEILKMQYSFFTFNKWKWDGLAQEHKFREKMNQSCFNHSLITGNDEDGIWYFEASRRLTYTTCYVTNILSKEEQSQTVPFTLFIIIIGTFE